MDTWLIVLIVVVRSSCCWSWRSLMAKRSRRRRSPQAGAGARAPAGGAGPRRPGGPGAGARRGAGRPCPPGAGRGAGARGAGRAGGARAGRAGRRGARPRPTNCGPRRRSWRPTSTADRHPQRRTRRTALRLPGDRRTPTTRRAAPPAAEFRRPDGLLLREASAAGRDAPRVSILSVPGPTVALTSIRRPRRGAMTDLLAIGTRKGLWLARSDDDRRTWTLDGPHLLAQEVAAVSIDTRRPAPRVLAGIQYGHWGPTVMWSDDLGAHLERDRPRRDPLPRGHRGGAGPRLAAAPRLRRPARRRLGRLRAALAVAQRRRRRHLRPGPRACTTTRTARPGSPAAGEGRCTPCCPTPRPTG